MTLQKFPRKCRCGHKTMYPAIVVLKYWHANIHVPALRCTLCGAVKHSQITKRGIATNKPRFGTPVNRSESHYHEWCAPTADDWVSTFNCNAAARFEFKATYNQFVSDTMGVPSW